MKQPRLAALVLVALGSMMILDQVQAAPAAPEPAATTVSPAPAAPQAAEAVAPTTPVTHDYLSAEAETSQPAESVTSEDDRPASDNASDASESDESASSTASEASHEPGADEQALPAVPALEVAPMPNGQPVVTPVNRGISTAFYGFNATGTTGTIQAHISYGDYDAAGYRQVAPANQISAQLVAANGNRAVPVTVQATQNPRLFNLTFNQEALLADQVYRVMITVANNQEQLWYGDRQYKQAVAGLALNAQGARISIAKEAAPQKGISTSFYNFTATDSVGTILAHIAYGTYDAAGYREVAPQSAIRARLEATNGQHQLNLTVRATQNPRLFNLDFDREAVKADQTYRVLISVAGKEEALWYGDNAYRQASGDLQASVAKQRVLIKKDAPARPAAQKGISTSLYSVNLTDTVATVMAHIAYGTYDAAGYREVAPASLVGAQLVNGDGSHGVAVTVKPTANPRVFEITFNPQNLRENQAYTLLGRIGSVSEAIWYGDTRFSQTTGAVTVATPAKRLTVTRQDQAKVWAAKGLSTAFHEFSVRDGVAKILAHIAFATYDAAGNREVAPAQLVNARLEANGRATLPVTVTATQNPRLFELSFDASKVAKDATYRVVAGLGNQRETIWYGDRTLSQQAGNLLLTAPEGRLNLRYQERLVNHEVKLRGIDTTIQVLDANGRRQTVPIKEYFGQRFGVASLPGAGTADVALIRNNKVFGYAKRADLVEVPLGKQTIYIDAGHGGSDTGAVAFGKTEKAMNLVITRPLADRLRKLGYEVYESRIDDKDIPLRERELEPNRLMPDIYISVHHNAMPANLSGQVQGILTLFHDRSIEEPGYLTMPYHPESKITDGKRLAQLLQRGMVSQTGGRDQGARPQNLHVTRKTDVPAALVELGFMDHAGEFRKLNDPTYQNQLITGLIQGIQAYFGKG